MRRIQLVVLGILLLAVALVVAGCREHTMISEILQKPDHFANREVTIAGKVTKTFGANLVVAEIGAYEVDDGSGKIWVITKTGVPQEGAEVGLKGTVSSGIKLLGERFGTVIQENERRTRN